MIDPDASVIKCTNSATELIISINRELSIKDSGNNSLLLKKLKTLVDKSSLNNVGSKEQYVKSAQKKMLTLIEEFICDGESIILFRSNNVKASCKMLCVYSIKFFNFKIA